MYEYILFDLDGTLTDPAIGITNGVMYALEKYGIKVEDRKQLYCFIGPPLIDAFMKYYGFSESDAKQAVAYYREFFRRTGIYENRVYDGVEEMLETLKKSGKILILATSKPQEFAEIVLNHFDLMKYFDCVVGATFDGTLNYKSDVIRVALQRGKVSDIEKAVMIGDRHHDIEGANQNNLKSVGVLYGFGDRKELENAGAHYLAKTPKDLLEILIKN
ncbi:MAG: HAD family hydrolase [Ruminococcaceae bacterium]|nr:HAD family hydrolase [Oscillospiraceae bacterium]